MRKTRLIALASAVIALAAGAPLRAQEPAPAKKWFDTAEFSYVLTAGNSEMSTLGFKDKLWRKWTDSAFELNAGGIRTSTTTIERAAYGTVANHDYDENRRSDVTAESYYLNGRYDEKFTEDFFWFGGAGWDRNTFAGIQNRYAAFGGVGNIWYNEDNLKFRTDYALTFTKQDDVVPDSGVDSSFFGARFSWLYLWKFTQTATYGNDFIVDENLSETSDIRANMVNWLAVSINKALALKVSLQWLYDNQPSLVEVDLYEPDPATPGAFVNNGNKVPVDAEKLDTVFQVSLMVNF